MAKKKTISKARPASPIRGKRPRKGRPANNPPATVEQPDTKARRSTIAALGDHEDVETTKAPAFDDD